jgi:hypothetical protein
MTIQKKDPLTLIRAIRKVKDKTNDIVFLLMEWRFTGRCESIS